ncbi:MAG: ABC transporter permease [Actinobacteria bacterium]|nr:ABC transporter permease [Actinomycetota bacterium]
MTADAPSVTDDRLLRAGLLKKTLSRPEFGSIIGAIAVFVFFSLFTENFFSVKAVSAYTNPGSTLGIMSVAIALLMIGGEFDLSSGVLIGGLGITTALLIQNAGAPVWLAMLLSLVLAVGVGVFNGIMVIKTKLPSFIVTLGTYFILQGAGLGFTRLISGQTTIYLSKELAGHDIAKILFASAPLIGIRIPVFYWLVITALATFVLLRSKYGNWIFSAGGNAAAARAVGVPVNKVKIALFVNVSVSAWLVAMFNTLRFQSAQIGIGVGLEFEFIIAAVIGGCLLTGGYGSAIGAAIGALIFEMVRQGLAFGRWDADWFKLFLGVMLLGAALLNQFVRIRAEKARS